MTITTVLILIGCLLLAAGVYAMAGYLSRYKNRYSYLGESNDADKPNNKSNTVDEFHCAAPEGAKAETITQPKLVSSQYIVFHLMAESQHPYNGYELLQALLGAGMRYGERSIFHRYASAEVISNNILFSLASATNPGSFDLAKIGSFTTPGLTFILVPEKAAALMSPVKAFDTMLRTVDQLVEELGGEVLDEARTKLTKEKVIAMRKKITALSSTDSGDN